MVLLRIAAYSKRIHTSKAIETLRVGSARWLRHMLGWPGEIVLDLKK